MCALTRMLLRHFRWHARARPNLPMWMRIARAHHRATVFENLHVADLVSRSELRAFSSPKVNDEPNVLSLHLCEREVVPRRKTDDAANAGFPSGGQQAAHINLL